MSGRLIIKGARCYIDGDFKIVEVAIKGEQIVEVAQSIVVGVGDSIFDANGFVLTPGFVDVHTHMREPGFSYKETMKTGTAAAARGGYTTIVTMPNLNPAPDSLENLRVQTDIIERDAIIEVLPTACITKGQKGEGELVDFEALAPNVIGFSDDGRGVQRGELMLSAMQKAKEVGRPIIAHCEDESLLEGGYIHKGEWAERNGHRGICSKSEWGQLERDLELVQQVGNQYHMCHLSTAESVELIRQAKAKGLKVSAETAPHYLLLTDEDLKDEGRFKMNPPLRSKSDLEEVRRGIQDGTIEMIATDHAPHSEEENAQGLEKSAFGIVGIETAFALLYTHLVKKEVISLERLLEMMCDAPRKIFGLPKVKIEVGSTADLVLLDLNYRGEINSGEFLSMGKATPFDGWGVEAQTAMTISRGEIVYKDKKYIK